MDKKTLIIIFLLSVITFMVFTDKKAPPVIEKTGDFISDTLFSINNSGEKIIDLHYSTSTNGKYMVMISSGYNGKFIYPPHLFLTDKERTAIADLGEIKLGYGQKDPEITWRNDDTLVTTNYGDSFEIGPGLLYTH